MDDENRSGRSTWHANESRWTPIILTAAITILFFGVVVFVFLEAIAI